MAAAKTWSATLRRMEGSTALRDRLEEVGVDAPEDSA